MIGRAWICNPCKASSPRCSGAGAAAKDISSLALQPLYGEFLTIHDAKFQALTQCLDEQAQHRILRAPAALAAPGEAPPPIDDLDHSDAEACAVAKEMHDIWSAVIGQRRRAHA